MDQSMAGVDESISQVGPLHTVSAMIEIYKH